MDRPFEPVGELLGIEVVECEPGHSVLTLTVGPEMLNGLGRGHGGILFTLADMAMALATNAGPATCVATHAEIDFLEPVEVGQLLTATAKGRFHRGKQTITDVSVTADDGTVVAAFRGRTLAVGPKSERSGE